MRLLAVALAIGSAAVAFVGGGSAIPAGTLAPVGRFLVYATPPGVSSGCFGAPDCRPDRAWVWRAALDGRRRKRLTHGFAPAVSPDGRWVAFVRALRDGTETGIDLIGSHGGPVRRLMRLEVNQRVHKLSWAPDSQRLVVILLDRRIVSLSLDGGAIVVDPDGGGDISFSPDGSQVAYTKTVKTPIGLLANVYVTPLSGGEPRRITDEGNAEAPAWGTAGITFLRNDGNVWIIQPDGSGSRQLTRGQLSIRPVAWSRDGTRLLGENPPNHNGRLWAIDGRTGAARAITGWVGGLDALALSRDGSMILATTSHGGFFGCPGGIETIPYVGGRARVLLPLTCDANWNA